MKHICESAEESSTLNAKHEPLADLNEDICDLLWLRMYFGDDVDVHSVHLPIPRVDAYIYFPIGKPNVEECNVATVFVEAKDEAKGRQMLCDYALAKLAEKRKVINRNIRRITAIKEEKK